MELKGISKSFKAPVISELSASFDRGFHVLFGLNGCGKTTLLKIISGRILPDKGEISADPKNVSSIFPNLCFYPQLTIRQNLEFFLTLRNKFLFEEEMKKIAEKIGADIKELDKKTEIVSSGNLVKAGLIKMFIEDCDVFLIDEVLSSLDESSFSKTMEMLSEKSKYKTIILVSHQKDKYRLNNAVFWEMKEGKVFKYE